MRAELKPEPLTAVTPVAAPPPVIVSESPFSGRIEVWLARSTAFYIRALIVTLFFGVAAKLTVSALLLLASQETNPGVSALKEKEWAALFAIDPSCPIQEVQTRNEHGQRTGEIYNPCRLVAEKRAYEKSRGIDSKNENKSANAAQALRIALFLYWTGSLFLPIVACFFLQIVPPVALMFWAVFSIAWVDLTGVQADVFEELTSRIGYLFFGGGGFILAMMTAGYRTKGATPSELAPKLAKSTFATGQDHNITDREI